MSTLGSVRRLLLSRPVICARALHSSRCFARPSSSSSRSSKLSPESPTERPGVDRADPLNWVSMTPPRPIRRGEGNDPSGFFPESQSFRPPAATLFRSRPPDSTRPQSTSLLAAAIAQVTQTGSPNDTDLSPRGKLKDFFGTIEGNYSASQLNKSLVTNKLIQPRTPWCKPRSGRTVHVNDGYAIAMQVFNRMVSVEKLARLSSSQVRFERRGLKKKRLRSERYIFRFKHAFVSTVQRVQSITRQGW